jgi:PIN domain nuclease of toxin-antitoxin system
VLALLFDEPGAAAVEQVLERAAISTANWSEVWQRVLEQQTDDPAGALEPVTDAGVSLEPLSAGDAERAARLRAKTRDLSLSLADRCCLALAARLERPVLTTDRAWAALDAGVEVRVIR